MTAYGPTLTGPSEVLHGYTLDHLHVLAKIAVNRARTSAADYLERLEAAWYGISEHLSACAEPPQSWDLVDAGRVTVEKLIAGELRQHGTRFRDAYLGPESAPGYWRFWWDQTRPAPSCENRVIERTALRQIWPLLSPRHREALTALAVHEDYRVAAEAMGVAPGTFNVHVSRARKEFLALWHEGEKPSRPWGTDRRRDAGPGGPVRPATVAVRRRNGRPEHELVHGSASTYTNHGCRCVPCTGAAAAKTRESRRAAGAKPRNLITAERRAEAARMREEGSTWQRIADRLGISQATAIRAVNGRTPQRRKAA